MVGGKSDEGNNKAIEHSQSEPRKKYDLIVLRVDKIGSVSLL